ncbi:MAG: hypothetical protein U0694_05640 [Anaerolineae bacterium]
MMTSPRLRTKLLFWLLLGALSVILAEVTSGSAYFPFTEPWGLLLTYPLYLLHTLVLALLIFRRKRVTLHSLFLAGAVFGMYEAYLTKVLWNPTWGDASVHILGLVPVQTGVLVLYFHPLMAFTLPVMLGEQFLTGSRETTPIVDLRTENRRRLWLFALYAAYAGVAHGINAPDVGTSLLSSVIAGLVFAGLAVLWQRHSQQQTYTLRELLPTGRQAVVVTAILLCSYVLETFTIRPEALPTTLVPHLTVWVMYAVLFTLLWLNQRKSPPYEAPTSPEPVAVPWRRLALLWGIFTISGVAFVYLKPLGGIITLLGWAIGIAWGAWLAVSAAFSAIAGSIRDTKAADTYLL